LAAAIRKQSPDAEVEIKPGGRGDFIVVADGQKLWDKRRNGDEFPDEEALLEELRAAD